MVQTKSRGERLFSFVNNFILGLIALTTIYPFIYIASMSFSNINAIIRQEVFILPKGFTLSAYKLAFSASGIGRAYFNSIWYTVVGTFINVIITTAAAYPLSRQSYSIKNPLMVYFSITMFFSGGMVPSFLLINSLGMYNTRWAIVIPGALSVFNMVIARVFFTTNIPEDLTDAARIDGANELVTFFKIVLPLSKAIIAVLILYYGVGHWNNFFGPLIYLADQELFPLSIFLRKVLITGIKIEAEGQHEFFIDTMENRAVLEQIKHASIILTMLPIMASYPFLQKYFIKGVMIGSLKG